MNKTTRLVLRLCMTACNLRRIPSRTSWACYSRTAALPYSSNSKINTKDNDLPLPTASPNKEKMDIVNHFLRATTSDEIFDIVTKYQSSLNHYHAIQALRALDRIYRMKNINDDSVSKRIEFLQLCEILATKIQELSGNEAAYILNILTHIKVPSTSVISQSLLQVIRSSLSRISFHRLSHLDHKLKDYESTPLVDALKIAIPIMCQIQLNNKMIDTSNISDLCSILLFLSSRPEKSNHPAMEMVINELKKLGTKMHSDNAVKILKRLCDLEYLPPGSMEVLRNVQQILVADIEHISRYHIHVCLGKIVKKVVHCGDNTFYNEEFVDACAKTCVSQDFGFLDGVKILKKLYILGHTQIRLIDYLAAKCFENPSVLKNSDPVHVTHFIMGLATTDYKPIFWESIQDIVVKHLAKNDYRTQKILIHFTVGMAVLDCFDTELIKFVFSESYISTLLSQNRTRIYENLLLLYQSVKLLHPNYNGCWPPQYMLDAAIKINGPYVEKSSLLPILETAMGGSQYILSNLKSKLGHHIDHIVVMRKGGYPVAINSLPNGEKSLESVTYIEDLFLPAETQVIIVMNLPADAYAINSHRMKGNWTLLLKTLELQTGHTIIPISSIMWNSLMDREKIPYLMQAELCDVEELCRFARSLKVFRNKYRTLCVRNVHRTIV